MLFSDEIAHAAVKEFIFDPRERALTFFSRTFNSEGWNAEASVNSDGKIVVMVPVSYPQYVEEGDDENYPEWEDNDLDSWEAAEAENKLAVEYLNGDWLVQDDSDDPHVAENFDWNGKYVTSNLSNLTLIVTPQLIDVDSNDEEFKLDNGTVVYLSEVEHVGEVATSEGVFNVYLSEHID